ncbi:MAG TPA: PKD domain-containing protein, partial [Candidatus Cloacimonetes bacterium]|nr:PKD domain-containing protein [Candidatus Cloacimonadota bacterium]
MSFMVFNPSAVEPPVDDMTPHSGSKMAACIASTNPPNNDWMITPLINVQEDYQLSFWAKSYTALYGLERFKVGISTTDTNPASFTIISSGNYLEAPIDWNEYTYDLSDYAGQDVYIGINCISNDAFFFLVDDFMVSSGTRKIFSFNFEKNFGLSEGKIEKVRMKNISNQIHRKKDQSLESRDLLGYNVYRDELQINDSIITDLFYDDPALDFGTYQYTVTAVYDEGESIPTNPAEVIIAEEDLKAGFTGTPISGTVPLTVQFTDLSTGNPTSWEWDFGDGETSIEQNPAHEYLSTGSFTVSLTISDGTNESTEQAENYIYVFNDDFLPPTDLQAQINIDDVYLTWLAPGGGGDDEFEENFEQGITPEGWTIAGENTDTSGSIPGFWTVNDFTSSEENIEPIDSYHCGLFWSYDHQDEWLITPEFECSSGMNFEFWSIVFEGSINSDHYYVKVSDDNGSTWDILWDASDLSSGDWNYYSFPYTIDLSSYADQNIKVAFNAVDGPTNDGIWYIWFVDNITASNESRILKFNPEDFTYKSIRNTNNFSKNSNEYFRIKTLKPDTFSYRDLLGYNIYRDGSKINTIAITDLYYNDQDLANGTYEYAVSAVYDGGESVLTSPLEVTISGDISYIYPGDTNNDGDVNETDIEPIGTYWRKQGNPRASLTFNWEGIEHPGGWNEFDAAYADCNGDGEVNITDVLAILLNWGKTHSATQGITISPEMIEAAQDNFIEIYENLGNSENEIKIKNHIADLFGLPQIEFIEQDLLYQNYPNPFNLSNNNSGTNISYQIAKDGYVELSIY